METCRNCRRYARCSIRRGPNSNRPRNRRGKNFCPRWTTFSNPCHGNFYLLYIFISYFIIFSHLHSRQLCHFHEIVSSIHSRERVRASSSTILTSPILARAVRLIPLENLIDVEDYEEEKKRTQSKIGRRHWARSRKTSRLLHPVRSPNACNSLSDIETAIV